MYDKVLVGFGVLSNSSPGGHRAGTFVSDVPWERGTYPSVQMTCTLSEQEVLKEKSNMLTFESRFRAQCSTKSRSHGESLILYKRALTCGLYLAAPTSSCSC